MNSFTNYQLNLTGAHLSDLFFNHEHPHRDKLYKRYANQKESPTSEELEEASLMDAADFLASYPIFNVNAEMLSRDFLDRI